MWLCGLYGLVIALAGASTRPATGAPATQPALEEIAVRVEAQSRWASYWLLRPEGHEHTARPALLIVLHGTDDTALEAAQFWSARRKELPFLLAAPQAVARGWRDKDLPALRATLADLRKRAPFDERRILIAGFSAGGSMAMHLLYADAWPLCAAAALANYVPPPLTPEQIRARRSVPVFYAVGLEDINHEQMRVGLERLRSCGANIDLQRPSIGHVLSPDVAQTALDWLLLRARRAVTARIDAIKQKPGDEAAGVVEEIVAQARWHERANVDSASRLLLQIEAPGREHLERAAAARAEGRTLDALVVLEGAESVCATLRLRDQAAALRAELLADPQLRLNWEQHHRQDRAEEALKLYAAAQRLVANQRYREALSQCEEVMQRYGDTPSAGRARFLADLLRSKKLVD